MVVILSKPPQDLGTALIIHKGRAKFCLNLSRYPRFCKKFKNQHKIAGISEKTNKILGLLPEKMEMAKKSGPRLARTAPEFKSGFGLLQLPQAGDVTHRQGEHQGLSGALDARLGHDVAGQNKERNSQQQEL